MSFKLSITAIVALVLSILIILRVGVTPVAIFLLLVGLVCGGLSFFLRSK